MHFYSHADSYEECIQKISHRFPAYITDIAIKIVNKFQSDFEERNEIEKISVYDYTNKVRWIVGSLYLVIRGEYKSNQYHINMILETVLF